MEKAILELSKLAIENLSITKLICLAFIIIQAAQIWQMITQSFLINLLVLRQEKLRTICGKKGNRQVELYIVKDDWLPEDYPDVSDVSNEEDKK